MNLIFLLIKQIFMHLIALINNNTKFSFLYGPKKSGKSYLSKIWLKKNNAIEYKNNYELFLIIKKYINR